MYSISHRYFYALFAQHILSKVEHPRPNLFVVSCGRSGSTLLGRFLEQEFLIPVAPESNGLLLKICTSYSKSRFIRNNWTASHLKTFIGQEKHQGLSHYLTKYLDSINTDTPIPKLYTLLQESYNQHFSSTPPFIVEKSPLLATELRLLHSFFPSAYYLMLFRDPRAVMESFRRTGLITDLYTSAMRWKTVGLDLIKSHKNPKFQSFMIPYEDFVANPDQWKTKLVKFLDIGLHTVSNNNSSDFDASLTEPHHANSKGPITTNFVEYWKTSKDAEAINEIYMNELQHIHKELLSSSNI